MHKVRTVPPPGRNYTMHFTRLVQKLYFGFSFLCFDFLGEDIEISIKMEATRHPDVQSRNLIAELRGKSKPEKVVVVSGHIDSWDVGQGAMDDGGGAFISWNSLVLLKSLGLQPKRTIRYIIDDKLMTNE